MRTWAKVLQGGAVLAAGIVLLSTALKSQAPARAAAMAWDYSVVHGNSFQADICYAVGEGCRTERVETVKELTGEADQTRGDMKAAAMLGAAGWELVAVTEGGMYFRRRPKR